MTNADDILKKLREKANTHGMSDSEVAHAVADAIKKVAGDIHPQNGIYHELEGLAAYIKSSRQELSTLRKTSTIGADHIPSATDELDAVTEATADATNTIMNQCDAISAIASEVGGAHAEKLQAATNAIFEACTFQDITGQRIAKVVRTLKHIEVQVNEIVRVFGDQTKNNSVKPADDMSDESRLLNGPQLPGNASSQDDIDALLASFDAPQS